MVPFAPDALGGPGGANKSMDKGLKKNVASGRGTPTARPEHMLAVKENWPDRPCAITEYVGPAPHLSRSISLQFTVPRQESCPAQGQRLPQEL
jgi:hypothetical protein